MTRIALALAGTLLLLTTAFAQTVPRPSKAGQGAATPTTAAPKAAGAAAALPADYFDSQVLPILKENCFSCHSGAKPSGGLNLTTRAGLLKGGDSGAALSLTKPETGLLIRAVHYDDREMPPTGKLPQAQIDVLTRWAAAGAPWPASSAAAVAASIPKGPPPVNAETMRWWSFQPVKRQTPPKVKNAVWVRNPIDAFVLAKLEANHLTPAPPASRLSLIRRVYYDVTGLPPSPAEVKEFLADKSPDAYEKIVDRLLASPQYGERWGRHWLDLVRYAETNNFERDSDKPFAWRYRDYVIRSFNDDKPYDQFLREQIAGDEMPTPTPDDIIATGYYRLAAWDDAPADPEQARADEIDDLVSTTGQTVLGLTVGCARCHDHKIDPIPQKDYYRFASFFQNVTPYSPNSVRAIDSPTDHLDQTRQMADYKAQMDDFAKQIAAFEDRVRPDFSNVEKEDFVSEQNRNAIVRKRVPRLLTQAEFRTYVKRKKQLADLKANPPKGDQTALCVTERGKTAPATFVLTRGNPHAPADEVQPAFLSVLAPPAPQIAPTGVATCGRRTALAAYLASDTNPLTARVMANRLWQFHFGRGIVRTSSNFGFQGAPPTHPELLDYLASELVRDGWKLKTLHREILLSNAYRMSSQTNTKALAKDPENNLLWRFDMRRLDAEEIHDSILAANGSLNLKMYGPSVLVTLPREVLAGQSVPGSGWGESPADEQNRRSVYVKVKRTLAVPMIASFDGADMDNTCPVRFATTQPTQALGMMNSAFVNKEAQVFADYTKTVTGTSATPAQQVRFVLYRVLQREPTPAEIARGVKLMGELEKSDGVAPDAALRCFCVVALNLDEFVYLD